MFKLTFKKKKKKRKSFNSLDYPTWSVAGNDWPAIEGDLTLEEIYGALEAIDDELCKGIPEGGP
jgi:hypothetical protein